jgi:Protein of unknown function (DUF2568)
MADAWNWMWLTVAFASELAALAALGHWGWVTGSGAVRLLLAIGAPAVAGVLWGVFAAPTAPVQVLAVTVLVKVLVFGSAVAALAATGHPRLALVLAAAAAASALLSTPPVTAPAVS